MTQGRRQVVKASGFGPDIAGSNPAAPANPTGDALRRIFEIMAKVNIEHLFPPIPRRDFDYRATYDGDEPNDNGQMAAGYGATKEEAINDLLLNYPMVRCD